MLITCINKMETVTRHDCEINVVSSTPTTFAVRGVDDCNEDAVVDEAQYVKSCAAQIC